MPNPPRRQAASWIGIVTALVLAGSACAVPAPGTSRGSGNLAANPPGYLRVVRTVDRKWNVQCVNDPCGTSPRFSLVVPTPEGVKSFDLVLTVTMDYTTTPEDWAQASVFHCPALNPPPPCAYLLLDPGQFPLAPAPSAGGSTITLSWSGKGLGAGYGAWRYILFVTPMDGSGDRAVTVSGRKVTAVFEMRPSKT